MFRFPGSRHFSILLLNFFIIQCLYAQSADSVFRVDTIQISGNKKTKTGIILRELTFRQGDTIHNWAYHRDQSRKQLINLFLFNEILIDRNGGIISVKITERWYIWPKPVLDYADRNFNQWWLSKDPARLIYGLNLEWYNMRGRNETMVLSFLAGYTRLLSFAYKVPYFNKKQTWGFQASAHMSANREVWYRTEEDKVQFFRDRDRNLITRRNIELVFSHRKRIFSYHHFYSGYRRTEIDDTVSREPVNRNYLQGGLNTQNELYTGYQYVYDRRDLKGYPLKGSLFKSNIEFSSYFLPASATYGQPASVFRTGLVRLSYSVYRPLGERLFASAHLTGRYFSNGNPPYSRLQALGYGRDYVRGYELNVIDGSHFGLFKSEFKYRFIKRKMRFMPKVKNYELLPLDVFLTAFWDAGYVYNVPELNAAISSNTLPNTFLSGAGTGINVIMFYDYCMRIEYAINRNAFSRFYLSFVASM